MISNLRFCFVWGRKIFRKDKIGEIALATPSDDTTSLLVHMHHAIDLDERSRRRCYLDDHAGAASCAG